MYKRRVPKGNSLLSRPSSRGSNITKANSSNLVACRSETSPELDQLPKELTSALSEYEENDINKRSSTSLMKSFSQKQQSTPKKQCGTKRKYNVDDNDDNDEELENLSGLNKVSHNIDNAASSYFRECISKCGAVRLPGNASYMLPEDQALFSMKLNKILSENGDKEKFITSFEEEIKDLESFKKMLVHTQTSDDVARGPVQDPLMRLLLNVDCLQTDLIAVLLGKLATIIVDNDSEVEDSALIASVVRQLRFLNRTKDAKDSNLAQKLFEIIEIASLNTQREIIFSLPEIISEEEHDVATKQLLELMKLNSSLTHVIIDALTNLSLKPQLRTQVRDRMLSRLDKSPPEFLPLLVKFIIRCCGTEDLQMVVDSLRKDLPFSMYHYEMRNEQASQKSQKKNKNLTDEGSYAKLTFENLKFSLMASKQMTDAWIKVISNINNPAEFRCIDFTILVIIYDNVFGRKNQITTLFRNKIKALTITEAHIHQVFKVLRIVLREYLSAILELASIFLKSFELVVSDFAGALYEVSFVTFNSYLRQNVISEVLLHIGIGTVACKNSALSILSRLAENHRKILSEHTVSIMGLLIKLPDLELMQVRSLIDIIAGLVYSSFNENSGLEDELQIFIRKQISSPLTEQHKKGIVAAIMFAKYAASDREDGMDIDLSEVNSLLEIGFGSKGSCASKRAFFNDELATLLREVQLNVKFVEFWKDKAYRYSSDNLFLRNIDLECEHFPISLQFALQSNDDRSFVFPAVDLVKRAFEEKSSSSLLAVAPSFIRLLWCSDENFDRILPFLSASVIMPDQSIYDKFETLSIIQQKLIMDCLFICCNYFIECINAFCTQKTNERILLRIKQLMELRTLIVRYINKVPDYTPPICQYYAPVQKLILKKKSIGKIPKKGKKRKLDDEGSQNREQQVPNCDVQNLSISLEIEILGQEQASNSDEANLHFYRGYFRELHCHTFKLLRMDLKLNPTKVFKKTKLSDAMINEEEWYYKATEKPELDATDLLFLLEDFIYKSEKILKEKKYVSLHKGKSNSSSIENVSAEVFISGSIKILPKICMKIELLSSYCKDLLDANDKVFDSPGMYPKDSAHIKLAMVAALKVVAELISWHGFRSSNYKSFLKDALIAIAKRGNPSTQENSISVLAVEAANYLAGFAEHVLLISGGLSIVKAVQSCIDYCQVSTASQKCSLAKLCYDLLLRPWFTLKGTPERGAIFNQHVDLLLKTYFSTVENKLEVVKSVTQIIFDECDNLGGKDSYLETFRTINKSNFPLMYRCLCQALVSGASEKLLQVQGNLENCLTCWGDIIQTLLMLVEIVKIHSARINLSALLKRSQALIQLFLSKGIPIMETALRVKSTDVLKLLKSLQAVTRFLHSICCHSKLTSDATVGAHVPAIRSFCERLTLEVKGMLILNKVPLEFINIATLKNKDLQGNDILSQETPEEESEGESELPSEEEGREIDENDGDVSTQESNSEVY